MPVTDTYDIGTEAVYDLDWYGHLAGPDRRMVDAWLDSEGLTAHAIKSFVTRCDHVLAVCETGERVGDEFVVEERELPVSHIPDLPDGFSPPKTRQAPDKFERAIPAPMETR